jgi:hypothetical protein
MGLLAACASTVLLAGALLVGPLGCSTSGGDDATGGAGDASSRGGVGGETVGGRGIGGASGSGVAGRADDRGGVGGNGAGGGAVDTGGQPPSPTDGGADSGATDAGADGPACTAEVSCRPVNSCRTGTTSCANGTAQCVETGYQPNGTACGFLAECLNGACNTHECEARTCTPTNPCHTGTISCATGAPFCQDTGAPVPDRTRCGTDKACLSGDCVVCSAGDAGCPNAASSSGN